MTDLTPLEQPPITSPASKWLGYAWALSPLLLGIPAGPYVLWSARRLRSWPVAVEAILLTAATVTGLAMSNAPEDSAEGTACGFIILGVMVVGTVRAVLLRRRITRAMSPSYDAPPDTSIHTPAPWNPNSFPAAGQAAVASSWTAPFECDGRDEHFIGIRQRQAWAYAAGGAALAGVCLLLHITGLVTAGIVLMAVPISATLTYQRVEGPVVSRRNFGAFSTVRLDTATSVSAAPNRLHLPARRAIAITGPDTDEPVRVLTGLGRHTALRAHLAGWLLRDDVAVTPEADAMLRETTWATPSW